MIFKKLTIKNFMSIGSQAQTIELDSDLMTLLIGENHDMLSETGEFDKNGSGKSACFFALSFVLYGTSLGNIRKDNMINHINKKGMLVTIDFFDDNHEYRIERGRKPGILRFYIDDKDQTKKDNESTNESQGESKLTQEMIDKVLGMSHQLFKHLIVLNTNVEPFLKLSASNQRSFIEELLGIKLLSEKAEKLKELIKTTKTEIEKEQCKINTIKNSNERIERNIKELHTKSSVWDINHQKKITQLDETINQLSNIDVEQEINNHKILVKINQIDQQNKSVINQKDNLLRERDSITRTIDKFKKDLEKTLTNSCPTCNQELQDNENIVKNLQEQIDVNLEKIKKLHTEIDNFNSVIDKLYEERQPLGVLPITFYDSIDNAYQHKTNLELCINELTTLKTNNNPYIEQIESLATTSLQEISYDDINMLVKLLEHQQFLLKLLTDSGSFIRKKIIDQNLSFLNNRLVKYLEQLALPHNVLFQNDLTVIIKIFGGEIDFENLSRGEQGRLILALSFAFRDVFELLNQPINLLICDEILDNGASENLVISAVNILKQMSNERGKNVFIVSHRPELQAKITPILLIKKENGFSTVELVREYS